MRGGAKPRRDSGATSTRAGDRIVPRMSDRPSHRWRIRTRLPERYGKPCLVTARGALNSIRVEFPDGFWCITSRWSVRRLAGST